MNDLSTPVNDDENGMEQSEISEHMGMHEHDLSEGGEFLNDGIRMNEQPFHTKHHPSRQ